MTALFLCLYVLTNWSVIDAFWWWIFNEFRLWIRTNHAESQLDFEREFTVLFEKVRGALTRYFNGELESFSDIPLSPKGTAFQQAIWAALRQIPYGKMASYGG